jgi:beta-glucosidase
VHFFFGHVLGIHAPGVNRFPNLLPVVHHQLLGHGLAVAALRAAGAEAIAIANNHAPSWPVGPDGLRESADDGDRAAARVYDTLHNRLFTEPILLGRYPDGIEELTAEPVDATVLDGDLAVISAPLDVYGVNYYNPTGVGAPSEGLPIPFELRLLSGFPTTAFGWPVVPDGLRELLVTLHERYPALPPVWITESGCCYDDKPGPDGSIVDSERIAYLDGHVRALHAAIEAGVDVRGYCVWSLLDNWEWGEGFTKRFGLVHVDFDTLKRTPKASFAWYRELARRQP